jgi:HK97 family phage portal protein
MSLVRLAASNLREQRGASGYLPWGDSVPPDNSMLGGSAAGVQVSEKTALQVAAVYGSVDLISDAIATLPVKVLKVAENKPATAIAVPTVIADPFSEISPIDFKVQGTSSLLLRGNFFGKIISRDAKTFKPTQVMPVHPDNARVRRLSDGMIEWRYFGKVVNPADVTIMRGLSTAGSILGLDPISALRNQLGLAHAEDLYAGAFFSNASAPWGLIQLKGDYDEDAVLKMARQWQQNHQGIGKSFLPGVLTGDATWVPVTMTPQNAQFLEQMQFSASVISGMLFRVPPHMIGMVDKDTCLTGDMRVYTEFGPRLVKDVQPGTRVWSLDELQQRFVLATVTSQRMTGVDPILTIRTRGRELRVNDRHRILARRKFPAPRPGVGGYRCVEWRDVWVTAGELTVGDYLVAAHGLPASEVHTAPNGRQLTPGFMEFCGLLLGDGNIMTDTKGDPCGVTIARQLGARYMDAYRADAQAEFTRAAMGGRFKTANRPQRPITIREGERCTRFSSRQAAEELTALGFRGTAHTKSVPSWVFTIAPDLQLAFLRGYADADGHVNRDGELIFSSVNADLLEDIRHLCIGLGVPAGTIYDYATEPSGVVAGRSYARTPIMFQLGCYDARSNLRIGSHDPEDLRRLTNAVKAGRRNRYSPDFEGRGGSTASRPGTGFAIAGAILHRITSITTSDLAEPVYDLSVDGTHTFLADGLVVHNSWGAGIEQQEQGFVTNTLLGKIRRWEHLMSSWLPVTNVVMLDLSHRLRGDSLQRWQRYQIARIIGAMNNAEIRNAEGLPLVDDESLNAYDAPLNSSPMHVSGPNGPGGDKAN